MLTTNVLRLNGENNVIEISFNKRTTITKIEELELSTHDLIQISTFINKAINAKIYKEKKENSFWGKFKKKITGDK